MADDWTDNATVILSGRGMRFDDGPTATKLVGVRVRTEANWLHIERASGNAWPPGAWMPEAAILPERLVLWIEPKDDPDQLSAENQPAS